MKKKLMKLILLALFCLSLTVGLTACGKTQNETPQNGLTFHSLTFENNEAHLSVSNATENFSFADEIQTQGTTSFAVSSDEFGQNTFLTKVVPLTEGDNVFYVFEMNDDEITQTYTITIRRRPIYTVSFEGNISSQSIEEGKLIAQPTQTPKRIGYSFMGWEYDFSTPVQSPMHIQAKWKLNPELEPFSFTFSGNNLSGNEILTITQLKDKTVESIVIPDYAAYIGACAFENCTNLKSIVIPDSVHYISNRAFANCTQLESVTLGLNVTSIEEGAFDNCPSLNIIYNKSALRISCGEDKNGGIAYNATEVHTLTVQREVFLVDEYDRTLIAYTGNQADLYIDLQVNKIGENAFQKHDELLSIILPQTLRTVSQNAFAECTNLSRVYSFASTEEEWNAIEILEGNENLINADRYYLRNTPLNENTDLNYWCLTGFVKIPLAEGKFTDCFSLANNRWNGLLYTYEAYAATSDSPTIEGMKNFILQNPVNDSYKSAFIYREDESPLTEEDYRNLLLSDYECALDFWKKELEEDFRKAKSYLNTNILPYSEWAEYFSDDIFAFLYREGLITPQYHTNHLGKPDKSHIYGFDGIELLEEINTKEEAIEFVFNYYASHYFPRLSAFACFTELFNYFLKDVVLFCYSDLGSLQTEYAFVWNSTSNS